MSLLTIRGLTHHYGTTTALQQIDLDLPVGLVALLGANGSGKSTLLRVLATLIKPDAGEISWGQWSYRNDLRPVRRMLGYLPQDLDLPDSLSPLKFLRYMAQLKGLRDNALVNELLQSLNLVHCARRPLKQLSLGQTRLVGVAQALLGNPRLLLLDELTRGLDIQERARVLRLLRRQDAPLAIFSTHIPAEAEQFAHYAVVLHQGQVLYSGTLSDLRSQAHGQVYEICATQAELSQLLDMTLISRVTPDTDHVKLRCIQQVPAGYAATLVAPTVEDAYLYLCARAT